MGTYIAMCKAATEIQEAWEPKRWDIYSPTLDPYTEIVNANPIKHKANKIWIPTIEQLIEMVKVEDIIKGMYMWENEIDYEYYEILDSAGFKVTLLAFVMHTLYNKSWNGKEWEAK